MTSFSFISKQYPLILASASPRRKNLLTQVGLPFRSVTSHVAEKGVSGNPAQTARLLAEKKACQVRSRIGASWVLGADTIVVIDSGSPESHGRHTNFSSKILGKPEDPKEAGRMLSILSGKEHRVITGFCILNPSGKAAHSEAVTTLVRIKDLIEQEIEAYIRTDEPYGKAGGYAIQGIGSFIVKGISGSYTNVVGLPLYALIKALVSVGALEEFPIPA